MEPRIGYVKIGRGVFEAMRGVERYLAQSGLDRKLMTLLKLSASQETQQCQIQTFNIRAVADVFP